MRPHGGALRFEHDAATQTVACPRRVHKIQGAGLVSADVVELLRTPSLARAAKQLAQANDLDAFGTKYFPVRPGSAGSVGSCCLRQSSTTAPAWKQRATRGASLIVHGSEGDGCTSGLSAC